MFIVTRQQKDGWEGDDYETNEIVSEKPAGQQAISTQSLTLKVHMHKGCTRETQGSRSQAVPKLPEGGKAGDPRLYLAAVVGDSPFDRPPRLCFSASQQPKSSI